jgi:uncharacterized protein YbjT (DUF2867 family)
MTASEAGMDDDRSATGILVLGATGTHGGGVARALLSSGMRVSALTRDRSSPGARALENDGAQLIGGDLDDAGSIAAAMDGIRACYAVTSPFEGGPEEEVRQGENIVSAAERARLPWLLMASVASARRADVPHYQSKARIERLLERSSVDWTIVAPTYFYENALRSGLRDGVLTLALPEDKPLQQMALETLGQFVTQLIRAKAKHVGERIELAADEPTPLQMAESLGARLARIPIDEIAKRRNDLAAMYRFLSEEGDSVDIAGLKRAYPQIEWQSFADWASASRVIGPTPAG